MQYMTLKKYIIDNYNTASKIFNLNSCIFSEPVIIDQVSELNNETINEYITLGCTIHNNDIIFPANIPFKIKPPTMREYSYSISRNGIDINIYYADELDVNIDLSDFGMKCSKLALQVYNTSMYDNIYNAYHIIKNVESLFNINIIDD